MWVLGPHPDRLNQKLWGWGLTLQGLTKVPLLTRDSDAHWSSAAAGSREMTKENPWSWLEVICRVESPGERLCRGGFAPRKSA